MRIADWVGLEVFDGCKSLSISLTRHVCTTEPLLSSREDLFELIKLGAEVTGSGSLHLDGGGALLGPTLDSSLSWHNSVGSRVPSLGIEVVEGRSGFWLLLLEHRSDKVDSNLTVTLVVSGAHINESLGHLVLTSDQDVVPLGELCVPNLLVNLALRAVNIALVAQLVEVQVD